METLQRTEKSRIIFTNGLPKFKAAPMTSPFSKFVRRGVSAKEMRRDEAGLMYRYLPSWGVGGDLAPSVLSIRRCYKYKA